MESSPRKMSSFSLQATFVALHSRNYRLWFISQLVSLTGSWMQSAAQGYLVYTLTGSPAYLGYVAMASGLPAWLFMLFSGVLADRIPRRKLMTVTQSSMMLIAFTLAVLVFTAAIQPWHILVLSFLLGTANVFETPARQSLVADLVERSHLTNAIALNVAMFNTSMIIGPAVAGAVYAVVGPAWCFSINGVSYLAVILALALMRIAPQPIPENRLPALAAIREGFEYIRAHNLVRMLMGSVCVYNIFDYAMIVFIPAFAVELLHGDATTNGLLLALNAGGAVLGGLILAASSGILRRGLIWTVSACITPIAIAGFAFSRDLPFSLLLTAVIGVTSITVLSNANAMVQSLVPDELRGRVMSFYALLNMTGGPVGSILLGVLADQVGVVTLVLFCSVIALAFAAWAWFGASAIRKLA